MQHLLDFIHQHSVDSEVYLLTGVRPGDLELLWQRREQPEHWLVRPYGCDGPAELVHRARLLSELTVRSVDMARIERELHALCATQIAFADMLLNAAHQQLGRDVVQGALREYQTFLSELRATVERLTEPPRSMALIAGGGARSEARAGHLSVVNATTSE
jgi:hypothetical protein